LSRKRAAHGVRTLTALAVGSAVAFGPVSPAGAQAPANPSIDVHVEYPDPPPLECPTSAVFERELTSRSARLRVAHDTATGPRLLVRLHRPTKTDTKGELSIRYADGTQAERTLDGKACDSVVDALALMSAMALDPTIVPGASPAPEPVEASVPPPATVTYAPATSALDLEPGFHVAGGLGGGAVLGVMPAVVPDIAAFIELAQAKPGVFSQTLRAAVDYSTSGAVGVPGGGVAMARTALLVDACPVRWAPGPLRLSPCAHAEAGVLSAGGVLVTPALTVVRPYLSAGLLGRLQFVFGTRFFVDLSGDVTAPFVRDRFYFEPSPSTTLFREPFVTGMLSLGLGVTIL
jgi:hypothetical protein